MPSVLGVTRCEEGRSNEAGSRRDIPLMNYERF